MRISFLFQRVRMTVHRRRASISFRSRNCLKSKWNKQFTFIHSFDICLCSMHSFFHWDGNPYTIHRAKYTLSCERIFTCSGKIDVVDELYWLLKDMVGVSVIIGDGTWLNARTGWWLVDVGTTSPISCNLATSLKALDTMKYTAVSLRGRLLKSEYGHLLYFQTILFTFSEYPLQIFEHSHLLIF